MSTITTRKHCATRITLMILSSESVEITIQFEKRSIQRDFATVEHNEVKIHISFTLVC